MPDISIKANYIHTNYSNAGNGYSINVYSTAVENIPAELQQSYVLAGKRKVRFSAKGYSLPTSKSYEIVLKGNMYVSSQYGLQLDVESATIVRPNDIEGIKKYLCDFIDGCGPKTASKIVNKFGSDTLNILDTEPERLYELRIRKNTVDKMIKSYTFNKQYAELSKLLSPFNCGMKTVIRIQNHFGKDLKKGESVVDLIKSNPFILSRERGFSFKTLNEMGKKYNISPTNSERICAGIKEILYIAEEQGHLYLPQVELKNSAVKLLNDGLSNGNVTGRMVTEQIIKMAKDYRLMGDNGNAYLQKNYCYETKVASIIRDLLLVKCKQYSLEKLLPKVESDLGFKLSPNQAAAVNMVINNQFSLLIGGAGTGKSTVLKAVIDTLYYLGYKYEDIALAAPTGKAARRMEETTSHTSNTIHQLLGLRVDKDEKSLEEKIQLSCKMLIVDEFSMVDMSLAYEIFTCIDINNTKVLFVGDTGQLPSVGAGNVLHELIASNAIPITELNVIFRQASENMIVKNSKAVNEGNHCIKYDNNFHITPININEFRFDDNGEAMDYKTKLIRSADYAAEIVSEEYINAVNELGIDNVQVLTPLKNNGPCCTDFLNKRIQNELNPYSPTKMEHQIGGTLFRENDRVIQLNKNIDMNDAEKDNNVSIYNGDTGRLLQIYKNINDNWCFKIDFGNRRIVVFDTEQMLNVELGYAITIHKSQGSEYKKVIIPLVDYFPKNMLYRNLLYTGITRAKNSVLIVGNSQLIHKCISNNTINNRNTALAPRIQKLVAAEKEAV